MRIIHYKAGTFLPLTETWIYTQINNLKRYEPIVYTHYIENIKQFPTNNIRALNNRMSYAELIFNRIWKNLFHYYPYFLRCIRSDRPNIIHAHFGPAGYNFLKLKTKYNIPMVTNFYGYDLSLPQKFPRWRKRYKKLFEIGEMFIVEGQNMKHTLTALGCQKEKIIVNHLGIDLGKIKFSPRVLPANGVIKILVSGSFREKKGIPYAIGAFAKVVAKRPEIKLRMTVIGDSRGEPREDAEKRKILNVIEENNLNHLIDLLGYQPYHVLLKEARNHHIYISPSVIAEDGDTEGGAPVTIIEMSASGMPILSTLHCDIPEVVIDGQTGFLVPERNVEALADRLEFLILNPDLWERLGRAGREHVEKEYDVIKQVHKLELLYDRLV